MAELHAGGAAPDGLDQGRIALNQPGDLLRVGVRLGEHLLQLKGDVGEGREVEGAHGDHPGQPGDKQAIPGGRALLIERDQLRQQLVAHHIRVHGRCRAALAPGTLVAMLHRRVLRTHEQHRRVDDLLLRTALGLRLLRWRRVNGLRSSPLSGLLVGRWRLRLGRCRRLYGSRSPGGGTRPRRGGGLDTDLQPAQERSPPRPEAFLNGAYQTHGPLTDSNSCNPNTTARCLIQRASRGPWTALTPNNSRALSWCRGLCWSEAMAVTSAPPGNQGEFNAPGGIRLAPTFGAGGP